MKGKLSSQTFVAAFFLAAVTTSAFAAAEETAAQLRTQVKVSKPDTEKTPLDVFRDRGIEPLAISRLILMSPLGVREARAATENRVLPRKSCSAAS
jgi:hypothetical protein